MKYTFSLFLITISLLSFPAIAQLQIVNTVAGDGATGFSGDGSSASSAELNGPISVAVDNSGNIFFVDFYNYRIRKVTPSGVINTIAGNGLSGYTGDASLATSAEITPNCIAVDKAGNLYVSDIAYGVVRKINTLGIISTVAGTGSSGYSGDSGSATSATLSRPCGLAVDTSGNLYIADAGNNVIRMVNTSGTITTIAGTGVAGYSGDGGTALAAQLDSPYAVAADNQGNIFISDYQNNVIRKIDDTGGISTYAGVYNTYGFNGDTIAATLADLNGPRAIAADTNGNLFIADAKNNRIRKVDTAGTITTAVGNGYAGFGGDLGTVNGANLYNPYGVAIDNYGSLYIADANNQRIRKTYNANLAVHTVLSSTSIDIFPNPFINNITVSGLEISDEVALYDLTGRQVSETLIVIASTQSFTIKGISAGVYVLKISDHSGNKRNMVRLIKD